MKTMFLCKIKRKKKQPEPFEAKEQYYIHNGAILLEKQISLFHSKRMTYEPYKIFSAENIKQATNNYDHQLILSRRIFSAENIKQATNNYDHQLNLGSGIATVFKGRLDDREVSIKVSDHVSHSESRIDFVLNQVATKQVINHKNVMRLYGCCLETQVPMLVLEFASNGTLYDRLHGGGSMNACWISWPNRVRIAAEISHALSYMHCGVWKPIVHLDVKSANIFLDENFTAKLSNFGFSVAISPGENCHGRRVLGTLGYIDPEYEQTLLITEACDVYSFGVLLIELLTGLYPVDMFLEPINLVDYFVSSMAEDHLSQIVHGKVLEEANGQEIQAVSELAVKCVGKRIDRPTMQEVASVLRQIYTLVRMR